MTKLILYTSELSPATRSTKVLIRYLGLDVEFRPVDVLSGEQLKPEFLKINPLHTLPTLDDNGLIVWDSHAINTYLVTKYGGNNNELYPSDVVQRTKIDQFLHLDGSTLFPRFGLVIVDVLFKGLPEVTAESLSKAAEALGFLNTFLEKSKYLTGDKLTLADISCASVPLTFERLIRDEYNKFDNVKAWINRLRSDLPYFDEIHVEKLDFLEQIYLSKLAENKK